LLTMGTLGYLFYNHVHYFRYMVSLYYLAAALAYFLLLLGYNDTVIAVFKAHDIVLGHLIFTALLIMSVLQIGYLQTWLLYHNALSSGVVIEDVLKYARRTKETANIEEDHSLDNLRTQLEEQKQLIKQLVEGSRGHGHGYGHGHPSSAGAGSGSWSDNLSPSASALVQSMKQAQQQPLLSVSGSKSAPPPLHKSYGATSSEGDVVQSSFQSSETTSASTTSDHDSPVRENSYEVLPPRSTTNSQGGKQNKKKKKQNSSVLPSGGRGVEHIGGSGGGLAPAAVTATASAPTLANNKPSESNVHLLTKKLSDPNILVANDFVFSQPSAMPPR
jgi:hypothetical protein